ncbi:hypothetical protein Tco_1310272 [Tanacetum coccineum]
MIRTRLIKEKKRKAREVTEIWMNTPITFPPVSSEDVSDEPIIVEAELEGYLVRRVYVDAGASVEVIKLPGKNTPQCYTKSLDSLKNSNNHFFWVDERVFPTVVDWRESAPKDEKPAEGSYSVEEVVRLDTQMDLFNLISAQNPAKVKTDTRPRVAHEVPLLTVTANRVIDMGEPTAATKSSGTPSTIERSPLDFDNENPSQRINEGDGTKDQVLETRASEFPPTGHASTTGVTPNIVIEEEDATDVPLMSKRRRKRVNDGADANAPPKVLRKDFDVSRPAPSTFRGKSFASTGLEAGFTLSAPASQGTHVVTIDPDPLSFTEPQPAPTRDIAESSKGATVVGDPDSEKSSSFISFAGSPGGHGGSYGAARVFFGAVPLGQ